MPGQARQAKAEELRRSRSLRARPRRLIEWAKISHRKLLRVHWPWQGCSAWQIAHREESGRVRAANGTALRRAHGSSAAGGATAGRATADAGGGSTTTEIAEIARCTAAGRRPTGGTLVIIRWVVVAWSVPPMNYIEVSPSLPVQPLPNLFPINFFGHHIPSFRIERYLGLDTIQII